MTSSSLTEVAVAAILNAAYVAWAIPTETQKVKAKKGAFSRLQTTLNRTYSQSYHTGDDKEVATFAFKHIFYVPNIIDYFRVYVFESISQTPTTLSLKRKHTHTTDTFCI